MQLNRTTQWLLSRHTNDLKVPYVECDLITTTSKTVRGNTLWSSSSIPDHPLKAVTLSLESEGQGFSLISDINSKINIYERNYYQHN